MKGILLWLHKNNFWYNSEVRAITTLDNWTGCESLDVRICFLLRIFSTLTLGVTLLYVSMWNNWCLKVKVADWDYTRRHFSLNTLYGKGAVCSKYISGQSLNLHVFYYVSSSYYLWISRSFGAAACLLRMPSPLSLKSQIPVAVMRYAWTAESPLQQKNGHQI